MNARYASGRLLTVMIKCDKRKEQCGQCARAHLICPGYQDPLKIIFNDETESVIRKAQVQSFNLQSPEMLLAPRVEDRAKDFFISQYVFCKTARFPYMEHFWSTRPHHPHLAVSIRAVSLAFFSLVAYSPEILQQARRGYSSALRMTNTALQSPDTAKHNATLLTVLLLDMYEKFIAQLLNDRSDDSKHLDGALAVLKLSGASQFDDPIRLRLFRQVSMTILLRCLRREDDVPLDLILLRQSIDTADQDGRLEDLMVQFVALQGAVRREELLRREIEAKVEDLDAKLVHICFRPPRWKFADAISGRVLPKGLFVELIDASRIA